MGGEGRVPIAPFLRERVFDPETIRVMGVAFTDVCSKLGLNDKCDSATQLVARKVIETAERGERDPARIASAVLRHFSN
jgi:hypothetical protein